MEATRSDLALFTDLYELTMLQAYQEEGLNDTAVFSLSVRRLPKRRNFLLACGLETVLAYLEQLRFTDGDIRYLATLGLFTERFLGSLREFRFTGDVHAVPEGTPVFANEPILEVSAPLPQAQLAETFVMNQIHLQTVLASKAARVVAAAQGRHVVDFGARRMHGVDAALQGARAFHIAGVHATSNVLAGRLYGLPVAGTMAHSYIQAHEEERAAFAAFARLYPGTTLLVDTYDTLEGVRRVIELARTAGEPLDVAAVRLDSGDLAALAGEARRLLDEAGLEHVQIFASSGLDEDEIARLLKVGAPVDGFGVGTGMGVSTDEPTLDIVYKLCEYARAGRTKLSTDKPVLPGRKQVFRLEQDGRAIGDVIARAGEQLEGRPLLRPVMQNGKRIADTQRDLEAIRGYARDEIGRLPAFVTGLESAGQYPVSVSRALAQHHEDTRRRMSRG